MGTDILKDNWLLEEIERAKERQSKRTPAEIALVEALIAERRHAYRFNDRTFTHDD